MPLDFAAELREWVDRCKRALGIGHIEISMRLVPLIAGRESVLGATIYNNNHTDWRRTVLHELIHIAMGGTLGTAPDSAERSTLETFVERQTRALYKLLTSDNGQAFDLARMCFRTAKTAREGGGQSMEQLIKMLMELAGDESFKALPPEALAKFQAVISAAAGLSGEASPPSAPEGAALAVDPMADKEKGMGADDKAYAMRVQALRAATERSLKAAAADAEALEKGAFVARIGAELTLTPAQETKIKGMPVEQARAYVEGIKESGAALRVNSASLRLGPADGPRGNAAEQPAHFEDLGEKPLSGMALANRMAQIKQHGRDSVKKAIVASGGV